MTTRHQEDFTPPVQLESLLEVPVKLILIEDLIREKAALALPEAESFAKSDRKCLFNCCASPSRWRNTDSFSNTSQFTTAGITLPWHESLAVIPVMQVNKSITSNTPSSSSVEAACANEEDTDTDVEVSNKNSNDDRESLSPDSVPLSLTVPSKRNPVDGDNRETNLTTSVNEPVNTPVNAAVSAKPTLVSPNLASPVIELDKESPSGVFEKVTEKPKRFEDFITTQNRTSTIKNTNKDDSNDGNAITGRKEQNEGGDINKDSVGRSSSREGNNSETEDTLKLTFYNEGRKEATKEFPIKSGGGGSSGSAGGDVRYFENQHGLQMSRVIRDPESEVGPSEGNLRHTQSETEESPETRTDNTQICDRNATTSGGNSKSGEIILAASTSQSSSVITQQCQQSRLTSSIVQNNNSATISNANSSNSANDCHNTTTQQQARQWEGLQISRCQKDGNNSVITVDGESKKSSISNREISRENVFNTSNSGPNPPENENGESENSIEQHLQSYLTSLRYLKPVESGGEKANSTGQEGESNGNKGRSPVILSPKNRQKPTPITTPLVSPQNNAGSPGAGGVVSRIQTIQRVSPSQQAASLESWPERTIARIPARPLVRRNSTYEQQQQQQQTMVVRQPTSYHQNNPQLHQQQPRIISSATPMMSSTANAEATVAIPLHSPPKRFKPTSNLVGANSIMSHHQQQQQHPYHQQGIAAQNRYANASSTTTAAISSFPNRNGGMDQLAHQKAQQQYQQPAHSNNSNLARISTVQQQAHSQSYGTPQQHYGNRQMTAQQPHLGSTSTVSTSSTHHLQQHQLNTQQQQQQQHAHMNSESQMYYQTHAQLHRHVQESLLMASSAVASSKEPVDSTYAERLRRYCDFYNRQELDIGKVLEYYKRYGFYPWDILSVRDDPIHGQMSMQQDQQVLRHQQQQHQMLHADQARQGQSSNASRYDMTRRMEIQSVQQQQQQRHQPIHHQTPVRNMSVVPGSPGGRSVSQYPQAQQPVAHAATMQAGMASRVINTSPPILSPQHSESIQGRYNAHAHQLQQRMQLQQQREYAAHQQQQQHQQLNNRYYHAGAQQQNYRHPQHQQQQHQQAPRAGQLTGSLPTNYDLQNSPHYRSAYNQLAAAAAAVVNSAEASAAASQHQLRSTANPAAMNIGRDERTSLILHNQSGSAMRPVIMTVSDPVPAPPEAVPLSIHRQALEQAIRNSPAGQNTSQAHTANQEVAIYRRDQRLSSSTSPHQAHHQLPQQAHHAHPYALGRPRINSESSGSVIHKEPLRIVSSPTLAHQTSVIRRIQQQQESPPSPGASYNTVGGSSHRRFVSERPGISYRRLSNGSSTDSNGGGRADTPIQTAFTYQQQHQHQHYQQQQLHHMINDGSGAQHGVSIRRAYMPAETGQGMQMRTVQKRRVIITDNNGVNQNHAVEACSVGIVSSPVPLIAGEEEIITASVSPSAVVTTTREGLPIGDDDSIGGSGAWNYDHVVLLDSK